MNLQRIRPVFGGHGYLLKFAGCRVVTDGHTQAKCLQVIAKHVFFLGRRALVHPKQANVFAVGNEIGRAHIGRQHGFFNQAVSHVAGTRHNFFDASGVVTHDLGFSGFKIHRPAHAALFEQRLVHIVQIQQVRHQGLALRGFRSAGIGQNGCHFGVGEAGLAEHHRWVKLIGMHFAFGIDQHVAHHAQALNIRVQRAQTIGQLLGQHRNHAARKVNAGCTVISVNVNGATGFNIVTDISNRHQQPPTLATPHFGGLAVHRIIEVACVFTVDSDQRNIGQVDTAFFVCGANRVR